MPTPRTAARSALSPPVASGPEDVAASHLAVALFTTWQSSKVRLDRVTGSNGAGLHLQVGREP